MVVCLHNAVYGSWTMSLFSVVDGFTYMFMVVVCGWWLMVDGWWLTVYVLYRSWTRTSCISSQMASTIQWYLVGGSCSLQDLSRNILPKPRLTDDVYHLTIQWLLVDGSCSFLLLFYAAKTVIILLSYRWSQPPSGLWFMVYGWLFVVNVWWKLWLML